MPVFDERQLGEKRRVVTGSLTRMLDLGSIDYVFL